MINLSNYRKFWTDMAGELPGIKSVMAITIDEEMGKRLQNLRPEQLPVLFYLPPSAQTDGNSVDNVTDVMECLVMIMSRYDSLRESAWNALEITQPIIEKIKTSLLHKAMPCAGINIFPESIITTAETAFYRSLAGWSISFTAK